MCAGARPFVLTRPICVSLPEAASIANVVTAPPGPPAIAVSEIGVSAHRMILPIMEVSGSIWVLENVDR
jgi:hypothetical protein